MPTAKTTTKKTEETVIQTNDKLVKLNIPLKGVKAKLQTARIALMDKGLKKSGKNDFAHFEFFQLKDFLPEVQRIFTKLGLTSNYTILPRPIAYIETIKDDGKIIREPIIKEIATLIITDIESDESLEFSMEVAPVQIGNNTKQNIYQAAGGRSTYYKRYLYRDALEIEEDDESDAVLGQPNVNYVAPVEPVVPTNNVVSTDIQQEMVAPVEVKETKKEDKVEPIINNSSDLLSQDSKVEIMNMINAKGLNGFDVINQYCEISGVAAPNDLKESDKAGLVDYVNSL